jgi:protein ImuA
VSAQQSRELLRREVVRKLRKHQALADAPAVLTSGIATVDAVLGGGFAGGALHDFAVAHETDIGAATGFLLALAARSPRVACVVWIAEDMSLLESGALYGPGLDDMGLAPERLITVRAPKSRDLAWAMEEALRCRAVGVVIGEVRATMDLIATRRLSLAAGRGGAPGFLLRAAPRPEASAAATRWIIAPAASSRASPGPGAARLQLRLLRNRRGRLGSWMLEWNSVEQRYDLAPAHREPVVQPALDRPHRAAAAA